jgi:hypothetical protein
MHEASRGLLQVAWRLTAALTTFSSIVLIYLLSGGGNDNPCLLEEACTFDKLRGFK